MKNVVGKNTEQKQIADHQWQKIQDDFLEARERYPEEDDGSYQWWENQAEYRSWNEVTREYRSATTNWQWKPWTK